MEDLIQVLLVEAYPIVLYENMACSVTLLSVDLDEWFDFGAMIFDCVRDQVLEYLPPLVWVALYGWEKSDFHANTDVLNCDFQIAGSIPCDIIKPHELKILSFAFYARIPQQCVEEFLRLPTTPAPSVDCLGLPWRVIVDSIERVQLTAWLFDPEFLKIARDGTG